MPFTSKTLRFILVDDDPLCNLLTRSMLRHFDKESSISDFVLPRAALDFIIKEYTGNPLTQPTVLFLDINMPVLTGWDFMAEFEKIDPAIKSQITVHILSSSLDRNDRERAEASPFIRSYLVKPLRRQTIESILAEYYPVESQPWQAMG